MSAKRIWLGLATGVLVTLVVQFLVMVSGIIPMHASGAPGVLDQIGHVMWERSMSVRAPTTTNPHGDDQGAVEEGLEYYRAMCVHCHGAPGVDRAEWAGGMQPLPPSLTTGEVQSRTDGELFHIIRHGIRMTGMPSLAGHSDEDVWNIIAFLRSLPELDEEQRQRLDEAIGSPAHDHGEQDGDDSAAGTRPARHEGGHDDPTSPSTGPTGHQDDGHEHRH